MPPLDLETIGDSTSPKPTGAAMELVQNAKPATQPATVQQWRREVDSKRFDELVYAQEGARSPPPGLILPTLSTTRSHRQRSDEPLYLDIDPRVHYPQRHSKDWHAAKQAEIKARGSKKANFGRALDSFRRQRRSGGCETQLPTKMLENPDWMKALRRLGAIGGDPTVGDWEVGVEGRQHTRALAPTEHLRGDVAQ